MKTTLIILALVGNALLAGAQSTYVTSFKTNNLGGPSRTVQVGPKLFFTAYDPVHGRELWSTDGTPAGTSMVKDILPGTGDGAAEFYELTTCVMNGILYFRGNDGVTGTELWRSDGTSAGTYMVKDLYPGNYNSTIGYLTTVGNLVYFTASTGSTLWKTDGTTAGTIAIMGFNVASNLVAFKNKLYFAADNNNSGQELWRSAGTAQTTIKLKDLNGVFGASLPCNFHATGNALYFTAATSAGWELWKTTGTTASTVMVKDINPGGGNGAADTYSDLYMAHIGNILYFRANDGVHGYQLWKTDGTDPGTVRLSNINPGVETYCRFPVVNGRVLFNSYNSPHFWQYDPVLDTCWESEYPYYYPAFGYEGKFAFIGTDLFYGAKDTVYGCEIWTADGTPGGTRMLQETHLTDNWYSASGQGFNSIFGAIGNKIFFTLARNPANTDIPLYFYNSATALSCFPPSVIVPVHVTGSVVHFVWNRLANSIQYELRYRKVGNTTWVSVQTDHSYYALTGLDLSSNYEYQVRSYCGGVWSGWSVNAVYNTGAVQNDYLTHIIAERSEDATTERIYWVKTPQIDKIQIRYRVYGATAWTATSNTNGYKRITGLQPNTFYQYQTRGYLGGAWESWPNNYSYRYFVTSGSINLKGLEEDPIAHMDPVAIFPNPTSGLITMSGIDAPALVEVMDNMGRLVKKQSLVNDQLDISDLPAGMYILSINTADQKIVRKIMKQ
jgi:ELWxxDGT repeat protein